MKLYVCYTTINTPPHTHPCHVADAALRDAGYQPEVIKSYGFGLLPDWMNWTRGRREVRELTGQNWVPVMVADDGVVVQGSKKIAAWAAANPAAVSKAATA